MQKLKIVAQINLSKEQKAELMNMWHLSDTAVYGGSRYEKLLWTAKEFAKAHPEYKYALVYKYLTREV